MASLLLRSSRTAAATSRAGLARSVAARPQRFEGCCSLYTAAQRPAATISASDLSTPRRSLTLAEAGNKSDRGVTRSITMVKKLTPDGEQCRKCNDIEARLERDGLLDQIDTHIYMNLEDPQDLGTQLAARHDVKVAPFFVVQHLDAKSEEVVDEDIYTVYLKMKKQVFDVKATKDEAAADVALSIF